ncbi:DUF4192 domain-containing protein [Pseudonocardia petroleophila]|uniref:DUF4192 domain-containing protein n=1 Tax=Pseudonocardia petroleophila TaxID=37331 RepID=A0A7G7MHB5_9PSEU|nr:DUF4192 domain-containing protein [Pseudonocardia petroleophila]QNG52176.1 DUF4192 domain-containing protein [Pseudonocardia petroleophila]
MTSTPVAGPAPTLLRLGRPADLVAAVPVMLGFRPRESLVLVATGGPSGRRIGLTLRVDLPPPPQVPDVVRHAAATLCTDDPVGAAVVVVGAGARRRTDVVDVAVETLDDHGVTVHTAVWAEHTDGGGRWGCFGECACTGVLPDPAGTELAAAAVLAGAVLRGSRDELLRLVEPVDGIAIRRREGLLVASAGPGGPVDDDAVHLAALDAALAESAAGRCVIDDTRAVALAAALTRPTVRDAVLRRCAHDPGGLPGAEALWAALCRELPDPEAAEPAALLAATALLRGEGALANVALDRAERSWPGHRLTRLLRSAASVPLRPAEIREALLGGRP